MSVDGNSDHTGTDYCTSWKPGSYAANVTVPFIDYIKNVASSEIYPTWPENALRANIYAQVTFALNRVYTEWYRSRGYDFDITNSTQYDQAYIHGRRFFPISPTWSTSCSTTMSGSRGILSRCSPSSAMGRQLPVTGFPSGGLSPLPNRA